MSGFTTKYQIPTLLSADPVSSAPTVLAALANRVDLLLGESGSFTIVAGATGSQAVVLSRTYPGSNVAAVPGFVGIETSQAYSAGTILDFWIASWTGSASTITGFTINWASSPSQPGGRPVQWRFLPVL